MKLFGTDFHVYRSTPARLAAAERMAQQRNAPIQDRVGTGQALHRRGAAGLADTAPQIKRFGNLVWGAKITLSSHVSKQEFEVIARCARRLYVEPDPRETSLLPDDVKVAVLMEAIFRERFNGRLDAGWIERIPDDKVLQELLKDVFRLGAPKDFKPRARETMQRLAHACETLPALGAVPESARWRLVVSREEATQLEALHMSPGNPLLALFDSRPGYAYGSVSGLAVMSQAVRDGRRLDARLVADMAQALGAGFPCEDAMAYGATMSRASALETASWMLTLSWDHGIDTAFKCGNLFVLIEDGVVYESPWYGNVRGPEIYTARSGAEASSRTLHEIVDDIFRCEGQMLFQFVRMRAKRAQLIEATSRIMIDCRDKSEVRPHQAIAEMFLRAVHLHPASDGNGRIFRDLLPNFQLACMQQPMTRTLLPTGSSLPSVELAHHLRAGQVWFQQKLSDGGGWQL